MIDKFKGYKTVSELADTLRVSKSTVYRWIKNDLLKAERIDSNFRLADDENVTFFISKLKDRWKRPEKAYIPKQISDYDEWHQTIDNICWLLKVCYSTKKDLVKKRFRLDQLFYNYLKINQISPSKVSAVFLPKKELNTRNINSDLKRGWYNELGYCTPIKESSLGLSFKDLEINKEKTDERFAFPSWKIISAYYAVYFYLRAVSLSKASSINLKEHNTAINSFNNNVFEPLRKTVLKFPLDIMYSASEQINSKDLLITKFPQTKYVYANHPRAPYSNPLKLYRTTRLVFKKKSKNHNKGNDKYTLFNYLRDFRIWANYQDIDNLLGLRGPGYKGFIDQDLSILLFFLGGISEICYISVFGEARYLNQLQHLYDIFACNNDQLVKNFVNYPPYQRLSIFRALGIVKGSIFLKSNENSNEISINMA